MRSTLPSTGLMSWVTSSTAAPVSRRCRSMSPTTACWFARSRLVSGSSHSSRRGSSASAWPDAQPLLLAAGEQARPGGRRTRARRPRRSGASTRSRSPRRGKRQPEAVAVDAERDEVAAAQRGVAGQRPLLRDVADAPVAAAAHLVRRARGCVPALSGSRPRIARSSVVLPEPLGPSTAMSSPGSTVRSRPAPQLAVAAAERGARDLQQRRPSLASSASWPGPRCSPASTRGKSGRRGASR